MRKLLSLLLIFAAIFSIGIVVSSCGDDDDDEPTLSFDQSIVGTWQITNVSGAGFNHLTTGSTLTFNSNGSCTTNFSMEDSYRIENGKIYTYYAETKEPMYVYTLLSKSGDTMSVRVTGTLDESNISMTINIRRTN